MFYVVDGKIYLAEREGEVYPEVKLRVDDEGYYYFKKVGGGLAKKPQKRSVLTKEEIIAKFGQAALKAAETPDPGPKTKE